jgi:ABC-type uncharacterized transport system substrate-binding protein
MKLGKTMAIALTLVLGLVITAPGQAAKGKKALFINSYHEGYPWSDQEEQAALAVLKAAGVETKVFRMDTYRQKSPEHLAKVSQEAKALIEEWKPDVVVVADDPVMKGVFVPFYKGKDLPFVSCGVNWDATAYGLPDPAVKNFTAMVEVCPVKELLSEMNKLKPGKTIGFLSADALTPKKDMECSSKLLGVQMEAVFVKDFAGWKQGFLDLQGKVDFLIIGVNQGLDGWDDAEAAKFVEANAKVVSGTWHDFLNRFALVSYNKLGAEHGEWAGKTAVLVLSGSAPSTVAWTENKQGQMVVNTRIAKKLGVTPSFEMLQNAKIIE